MDRIDPVIKVLAELAFAHQCFQVHIRSADKADVHGDGLAAADPHDAAVLDRTQQFRLQVQGDVANLIEEERPTIGLFKLAGVVSVGIREGSFHVAEEFAFEERFRDGAGIDSHHRPVAPEAQGVDFPGQYVLAGAIFAGDEYRGVRGCGLSDRLPDGGHRLGGAPVHRFLDCARNDKRVARNGNRVSRDAPPHRLAGLVAGGGEGRHQLLVVPGLDNEVEGSALHPFHGQLNVGIGGEEDDFHVGCHLLDFPGPVEPFVARIDGRREVHIQEHHVRPERFQGGNQGRGGRDRLDFREMHRKQDLQRLADAGVVIDDQNFACLACLHRRKFKKNGNNCFQKWAFS